MALSGHAKDIKSVAFSRDGSRAVTGSNDGTLRLWSASNGGQIAEMTDHKTLARRDSQKPELADAGVEAVAVSPADQMIASSSTDGRVLLWDGRTGTLRRQLANPDGMVGFSAIRSVSFSPDGRWVLAASEFEGCAFYDVAYNSAIRVVDARTSKTSSLMHIHQCIGGS